MVRLIKREVPCAMTIAGSDSGGGAGIEADLKTFAALGVFGTCAITALTAQNTMGVYDIFAIPPQMVKKQIEVVLEDIQIKAAKTGMLYSKGIMNVVAEAIDHHELRVVLDPVFRAGAGNLLIREEDKEALIQVVVPRSFVITPNKHEAEDIARMKIKDVDDMKKAASSIAKLGAEAVVVKGGHLKGANVIDVLHYNGESKTFAKPRVEVEAHGGGCTFSAAIAAYLALDCDVVEAVTKAEEFMQNAITFGLMVGKGRVPVNPMASLFNEVEKHRVLEDVSKAAKIIEDHPEFLLYMAEVGIQIAMALPYASGKQHVAAVEGRVVKFGERAKAVGCVKFGVSDHVARIILTAMKYDPSKRAALNLRYDQGLVEAFKKLRRAVSSFDRRLEPPDVKAKEGGTLAWGMEEAIKAVGRVPDIVYDLGEVGKEPMIRVLGNSAIDAVEKALASIKLRKHGNPH